MYLFDREAQAPEEGATAVFKLYHYDPTIAGGVVFVLLFTGTTLFAFLAAHSCTILVPYPNSDWRSL